MTFSQPVNLTRALESFEEIYSPRIVATMNHYDVRIAKTKGDHVKGFLLASKPRLSATSDNR